MSVGESKSLIRSLDDKQDRRFDLSSLYLSLLFTAIAIGLLFVAVKSASTYGRFIPTVVLEGDYLIGLIWGAVLLVTLLLWPATSKERGVLLALWSVRLATTLIAMLIYENQYDFLDSYSYFAESRSLSDGILIDDLAFGTRNVTYLFASVWEVLPHSFHALKVTCAYAGLVATFLFYRAWQLSVGAEQVTPLWILGLTPSLLFWASVLGKDPIVYLGIAMATWGVVASWKTGRLQARLVFVAGVVLMSLIRPWMGPIVVAALGIASIVRPRSRLSRNLWIVVSAGSIAVTWYLTGGITAMLASIDVFAALEAISSSWAIGGSASTNVLSFSSVGDIVRFLPLGAFTALFRPLPGEIGGAFGLAAGLENLILLLLVLWAALRLVRVRWEFPMVFCICMIVVWTGLYAFLSYQNLGTAVRFKLQVMPFLIAVVGMAWHSGTTSTAAESKSAISDLTS